MVSGRVVNTGSGVPSSRVKLISTPVLLPSQWRWLATVRQTLTGQVDLYQWEQLGIGLLDAVNAFVRRTPFPLHLPRR